MADESDADLLRRAAALVRARGVAPSLDGPWTADRDGDKDRIYDKHDCIVALTVGVGGREEAITEWVSLVGPQIAGPLAAWLEDAATVTTLRRLHEGEQVPNRRPNPNAVAVARALLGEAAP